MFLSSCRCLAGQALFSVLLQCVVKTVEGQPFVAPRCVPVACAFSTEEVRCPFPANGSFIRTPKPDPKMECDDPFMEGARRRLMPPCRPPPLFRVFFAWPARFYLCHLLIERNQPGFWICGARMCDRHMTGCFAAEKSFCAATAGRGQRVIPARRQGKARGATPACVAAEGAGAAAQVH